MNSRNVSGLEQRGYQVKERGGWLGLPLRSVARMVALVSLVLASATGCATGTHFKLWRQSGEQPAPRLVQALESLPMEGSAERTCFRGIQIHMTREQVALLGYEPCELLVNPAVLRWPDRWIRAGIAHELGHMTLGHASALTANMPQLEKEREADAYAVRILSRIGLHACLGLPDAISALGEDPYHPSPSLRAASTRAACYGEAARAKEMRR